MKTLILKIIRKLIGNPLVLDSMHLKFLLGQNAILASSAIRSDFKDLWDAEVKVFSQWGEDGILNYLLDLLDISKPRILEIGVGDFSECNSRFSIVYRGASAVLVDFHSGLLDGIEKSNLRWKSHIFGINKKISLDNCNEIFTEANRLIGQIDVLSLDIDSIDYWILKNFDSLDSLQIIIVEYNSLFGSKEPITVPYHENFDRFKMNFSGQYYGASIQAWINLLDKRGFSLIGTNRICNNAFFIRKEKLSCFKNIRIPNRNELEKFVDWRCRDARNSLGDLIYASGDERLSLIKNELVQNTITGEVKSLGDARRGDRI